MENHELYHHGVLGQKWGIRRYQNKDGTLTPAGRKRQEKLEKKRVKKEEARSKKIPISKLSNEELIARTQRLQMEKNYLDLKRQISSLNPQQASKGRNFVKDAWDKSISPAILDGGKKLLNDWMVKKGKKMLGLEDEPDTVNALEKEWKTLNYKKKIKDLKDEFKKAAEEEAKTNNTSKHNYSEAYADQAAKTYAGQQYVQYLLMPPKS